MIQKSLGMNIQLFAVKTDCLNVKHNNLYLNADSRLLCDKQVHVALINVVILPLTLFYKTETINQKDN